MTTEQQPPALAVEQRHWDADLLAALVGRPLNEENIATMGRFGWLDAFVADFRSCMKNPAFAAIWTEEDPSAAWEALTEVEALIRDTAPIVRAMFHRDYLATPTLPGAEGDEVSIDQCETDADLARYWHGQAMKARGVLGIIAEDEDGPDGEQRPKSFYTSLAIQALDRAAALRTPPLSDDAIEGRALVEDLRDALRSSFCDGAAWQKYGADFETDVKSSIDKNIAALRSPRDAEDSAGPSGGEVEAVRLLAEYAQKNGYDRFRWGCSVQTPGEQREHYDVIVTGPQALRAASSAEGWRDIESAPKDRPILVFWKAVETAGQTAAGAVALAWWDAEFELTWDDDLDSTAYRGAWTDGRVASWGHEEVRELNPLLWTPLPIAPARSEGGE